MKKNQPSSTHATIARGSIVTFGSAAQGRRNLAMARKKGRAMNITFETRTLKRRFIDIV